MGGRDNTGRRFDFVAEGYDFMDSIFHDNDFFIAHMPARRGRALDIGCGSGIMASALAPHFDDITGIDISEPMLEIARTRHPHPNVQYLNMDAAALPPYEKFDYIVSRTTFHHIEDLPALLARLKAMLNPGGKIAVLDCAWKTKPLGPAWSRIMPWLELPENIMNLSPRTALKIFRFRLSKPWLHHLDSDRYMTRQQFTATYTAALPGCKTAPHNSFMSALFEKHVNEK